VHALTFHHHIFCDQLPIFCDTLPIFCDLLPIFCDTLSIFCDTLPIFCDLLPIFCDQLPIFCDLLPIFCDQLTRLSCVADKDAFEKLKSDIGEGNLMLESLSGFFIIISPEKEIVYVSDNVEKHIGLNQVS